MRGTFHRFYRGVTGSRLALLIRNKGVHMFNSRKCVYAYACLALMLAEASCAPSGGGLVPGDSAVSNVSVRRDASETIVGCKIVTPKKRTVLNPPPKQTFAIPPSLDASAYVFYFEIGIGNWCYSLPQAMYATVPGTVDTAKSEVVFEAGHDKLVLQAGHSYIYAAYAVPAKPAKQLYVIDHGTSNVSVFLAGANGNVAPIYRITNVGGPHGAPQGLAVDSKGHVLVTTIAADGVTTSLVVYAPGARGNAKPVRVITGPDTTLTNNSSDTGVGPDGSAYVNNGNGIAVFAPNADGDAKPVRLITGLNGGGAAVSPSDLLYTSTAVGTGKESAIDVFGPNANGPAQPLAAIEGSRARVSGQLTGVDPQGNVYQCRNKAVIEFASFQSGNVYPIRDIHGGSLGFTGLQPIAVDGAGNVFVGDEDGAKLYRFAPNADGNVEPLATIAGGNTGLINPAAIAVDK